MAEELHVLAPQDFINSNEISSRVHFFTELTPPKYPFSPAIPMSETIVPPSDVQDKGRLT